MKRIFNALIYGDWETKKSIGSVILFAALGICLIIISGVAGQSFLLVLGMISGVVSLIISQSFELVDEDFVAEVSKDGKKDTVHSLSVKKDGIVLKNSDIFKRQEEQRKKEEIEEAREVLLEAKHKEEKKEKLRKKKNIKEEKAKKKLRRKEKKLSTKKEENVSKEEEQKVKERRDGQKEKTKEKEKKSPKKNETEERAEDIVESFERYNEQVLRQVKRRYHVRKEHLPIIIDNSDSYHIKECPAFIWRIHNKVYLLLLEKEPRKISISRDLIKHVGYVPHVRADKANEYKAFEKENLVTSVFREYLPDYFNYKSESGSYRAKNLYYIYPDIRITARSIAKVMDLLYMNFMPSDKITRSDQFNGFFKRIYAAHILFSDKAYSITEYKYAVEEVLGELCHAQMPQREFNNTLENLVKGRFISQEYADYYYKVRIKVKDAANEKK